MSRPIRAIAIGAAAVLALSVAVSVDPPGASANYIEPDRPHTSTELATNGDLENVSGQSATGWTPWQAGYTLDSSTAHSGQRSIACEITTTGECGSYQYIAVNQSTALPLEVSGWSRAQNVSGTVSTDYSIYVDLTFVDSTHLYGEAKGFATGSHDWLRSSFYIDPAKPVQSLVVYTLFRNKTGKVWFDDVSVAQIQADLLAGGTFESVTSGQVTGWNSWGNGYTVAAGEGRGGTNAVKVVSASAADEYGIHRTVELDQSAAKSLLVRGWSKATSVAVANAAGYSLYADVEYMDGTNEFGLNQPFSAGTHDWQNQELYIVPAKPIRKLAIYALFRGGTGTVWFDNLSLEQLPGASDGGPALGRMNPSTTAAELLANPGLESVSGSTVSGWGSFGSGYTIDNTGGRDGGRAVKMTNSSASSASGIYQTLQVNQSTPALLVFTGWSRSNAVSGDIDRGYALYMDVFYQDGSTKFAVTMPFATGTNSWSQEKLYFQPQKAVQTVSVYGIFRDGHVGDVWFDDFSFKQVTAEAAVFEDALVRPLPYQAGNTYTTLQTGDGFQLGLGQRGVASVAWNNSQLSAPNVASGFLARDQQADSDAYGFDGSGSSGSTFDGTSGALDLKVDAQFQAVSNGIKVSGKLSDLRNEDRAVTLTYALPVDATGWKWGDYIRGERSIQTGQAGDVYTNSETPDFETGPLSIYPMSAIYNPSTGAGLSLGVDYNKPTHYRLDYNGSTKQLTITFELGLSPHTKVPSTADFGFVIYGFDGATGFRGAFDKYMKLFPDNYQVRIPHQGIWMPFASISNIPNNQDFGFRFKEGDDDPTDTAYANAHDVLVFHYQELGSWWQSIDPQLPKTVQTAESARDASAANGDEKAKMAQSAAMKNPHGDPYLQWLDTPWNVGALWMINANPDLPGEVNGYSMYFSPQKMAARYNTTGPKPDGEYLDTLDGWPYTLNYDEDQFAYATAPLVFSKTTGRPALHRAFSSWEATSRLADELHANGRYLMANGTPHIYSMYQPWLDAMGNERNWLGAGNTYNPDDDATLSKYRTLSGQKPYLILQNTDFSHFGHDFMEKYMQRLLFYGIYPSAFSATADDATNYWKNPTFYERDRSLFVKYIPLVQSVAEAGWQPLTLASANSPALSMERYGSGHTVYLTVMNQTSSSATSTISFDAASMGLGSAAVTVTELTTTSAVSVTGHQFSVTLGAGDVRVYRLTTP